jgi:hypothetical protein
VTDNSPIRDLLRVIGADAPETLRADEVEVTVDRDGKVLGSVLARAMKKYRRFATRPRHVVEVKVQTELRDFKHDASAVITFRIQMSLSGNPEAAVKSLFHRDDEPWVVLKDAVHSATDAWWSVEGAQQKLPARIAVFRGRDGLCDAVARWLGNMGFAAKVVAEVDDWDAPPVEIRDLPFKVRMSDYADKEYAVTVSADLGVIATEGPADARHPKTIAEWESRVKDTLRAAFRREVKLSVYLRNANELNERLRAAINADLAGFGRACDWIVIKTEAADFDFQGFHLVEFVWSSPQGRSVEFKAQIEASVTRDSEPLYLRSGKPNLKAWFTQCLSKHTQELLLREDYTSIDPGFADSLRTALEQKIQEEAKAIGVAVQTLVLRPQLPEWDYLKAFEVKIDAADYESAIAGAPFRFSMVVTGHFDKLDQLKDLTQPADKVKQVVAQVTRDAAATVARTVDVHEFLTHFDPQPDDDPAAAALSIRARISSAVTGALVTKLQMSVDNVEARPEDTEFQQLIHRFKSAEDKSFDDLEVRPLDPAFDSERFKVQVTVRLNAITADRALQLRNKGTTPQAVMESLRKWTVSELERSSRTMFHQSTGEIKDPLRRRVAERLEEEAKASYGAIVEVLYLRVEPTDTKFLPTAEAMIDGEMRALALDGQRERLRKARERVNKAIEYEGSVEDALHEARLAKIKAQGEVAKRAVEQIPIDGVDDLQRFEADMEASGQRALDSTRRLGNSGSPAAGSKTPPSPQHPGDAAGPPPAPRKGY